MSGSTKMFHVSEGFDLDKMAGQLVQLYQSKGFEVQGMWINNGVSLTFSKDDEGVKKFLGLALGIKANLSVSNNTLVVNFYDAEWTGKIIALAVGWILCLVPFCIGIYGSIKQSDLPKSIGNDIQMIVGGGGSGFVGRQV